MTSAFDDGGKGSRSVGETWVAAGASVVGTSHLARQTRCQDSHSLLSRGPSIVMAVADGLGSCARSHVGSSIAAATFVESIHSRLRRRQLITQRGWTRALERSHAEVVEAIASRAQSDGEPVGQYATTLLGIVVTPRVLATIQVGDGAIVVKDANGLTCLPAPLGGEYANETITVLTRDALKLAVLSVTPSSGVQAVAALSDGVERVAVNLSRREANERFFGPVWETALDEHAHDDLGNWLRSDRVTSRTDDDLTLAIAVRKAAR